MISALDFQYAGKNSSDFNLKIAAFGNSDQESYSIGPDYAIIEEKVKSHYKPYFMGVEVSSKLTFPITLVYINDELQGPMHKQEISRLFKWLLKTEYHELKIIDDEYGSTVFNCMLSKAKRIDLAGFSYAIEVEATCDGAWGYMPKTIIKDSTTSLTFNVRNLSSLDLPIYPEIEIKSKANGPVSITNNTLGITSTFSTLTTGEKVYIDTDTRMIVSDSGANRYETFNFNWFEFNGDSSNSITITGNAKVTFRIKYPFIA